MVHLVKDSGIGQAWLMCGPKFQAVPVLPMWALSSSLSSGLPHRGHPCLQASLAMASRQG